MSKETVLASVLADLQSSEPASLLSEDKAYELDSPGWTPNRMQPGWTPNRMQPGWTPNRMQPGWTPNRMQARTFVSPGHLREAALTEQTSILATGSPGGRRDHRFTNDYSNVDLTNESVWPGVERLLHDYIDLRADDFIVVAYTLDSRLEAARIITALKELNTNPSSIPMRPIRDEEFQGRLEKTLPPPTSVNGRVVILTVERHSMSHYDALHQVLTKYDPSRWLVARIIGASEEFFTHAMREPRSLITARNSALLEKFMKAREMRVKTRAGTDLRIGLNSERFHWISNRGSSRPGAFIVLPPGEIATYPASLDGVFVADGAININVLADIDARLASNPVEVTLKNGRAIAYTCASSTMTEFLDACFSVPNMDRVGELGFGTNCGITKFISENTHINERRTGVHLGFGQNNQSPELVDYQVDLHMDLISDGAMIWLDDNPVPTDLANIPLSYTDHPSTVLDEDIDGDCCGLWLSEVKAVRQVAGANAPQNSE